MVLSSWREMLHSITTSLQTPGVTFVCVCVCLYGELARTAVILLQCNAFCSHLPQRFLVFLLTTQLIMVTCSIVGERLHDSIRQFLWLSPAVKLTVFRVGWAWLLHSYSYADILPCNISLMLPVPPALPSALLLIYSAL